MVLLLLAIGVLVGSGAGALAVAGTRWAPRVGAAGAAVRLGWDVPYGAFFVQIDALSAFFLVPILCLSALAAVYGTEYLSAEGEPRRLGAAWCFFNLLVASMALVVVARNAMLFLVAWEVMALASFFLVTFDDEQPS